MTDIEPITDEEIEYVVGWIDTGCPVWAGKGAMEFLKHDTKQAIARIEADRKRIAELEAQVAGFGELTTAQYEQVRKLEAEVERLLATLDIIFALAVDYDGFKKPESLKSLIRDMAAHAYHKKPLLQPEEMEDGWRIAPIGKIAIESEPTDDHE